VEGTGKAELARNARAVFRKRGVASLVRPAGSEQTRDRCFARAIAGSRAFDAGYGIPKALRDLTALERAIAIVGGMAALARTLGVSPAAVWKWRNLDRIPAERVIAIERATNGLVTRAKLRPDLFGEDVEAD